MSVLRKTLCRLPNVSPNLCAHLASCILHTGAIAYIIILQLLALNSMRKTMYLHMHVYQHVVPVTHNRHHFNTCLHNSDCYENPCLPTCLSASDCDHKAVGFLPCLAFGTGNEPTADGRKIHRLLRIFVWTKTMTIPTHRTHRCPFKTESSCGSRICQRDK
jgi:hypothetical protein